MESLDYVQSVARLRTAVNNCATPHTISAMTHLEPLGSFVRRRREAIGMSQIELATAAGLTKSEVSSLELGRIKLPSAAKRRALAGVLRLRHVDLLLAAGELTPDEVPHAGETPTVGHELAARIDALPLDLREGAEWFVARLEQVRAAEAAGVSPPAAARVRLGQGSGR